MWVGALTGKVYGNHRELADDIVRILREELIDLRDAGCDFVQFVLEYATPSAGDIEVVGKVLADRELGLGVVNPRTDDVETPEEIVRKAEKALEYYRPEQLFLNTDCGFGCFAGRSVNVEEVAYKKLCSIVAAATELRRKYR